MNVNYIRKQFVSVQVIIKSTVDKFVISETKIADSLLNALFKIEGYKSFKQDRDVFGEWLLFYIHEKLNCRYRENCLRNTYVEILPLEHRLLNSKWLLLGT